MPFPDFPGCVTVGTDLDEARGRAEEVLAFHIEGMMEDGHAIPESSGLERVMADRERRDGVAILIPSGTMAARAVRAEVAIPEDLIGRLVRCAAERRLDRSGFQAHAARQA